MFIYITNNFLLVEALCVIRIRQNVIITINIIINKHTKLLIAKFLSVIIIFLLYIFCANLEHVLLSDFMTFNFYYHPRHSNLYCGVLSFYELVC